MSANPKISLEQWRALAAVVDAGGYAHAAEALHKSQSAVTYAVQKLESLLGVKAFEVLGRKAHLTPTGEVLYHRAKALLEEAGALEGAAAKLGAGWEPELRLAVDIIFPTWLLLQCLERFAEEQPLTHLELYETVISGTVEALIQRRVDLAICAEIPPGFAGDTLMPMRFICAAHPDHPLHRLGRPLTLQDLRKHRHLVVRDTGSQRTSDTWLGAEQRLTVSHKATSIHAACMGLGFAWFPEDTIRSELAQGQLKPLPLRGGAERHATLYLVFADRDYTGPGALRLAEIIREGVARQCQTHQAEQAPPPAAPARRSAGRSGSLTAGFRHHPAVAAAAGDQEQLVAQQGDQRRHAGLGQQAAAQAAQLEFHQGHRRQRRHRLHLPADDLQLRLRFDAVLPQLGQSGFHGQPGGNAGDRHPALQDLVDHGEAADAAGDHDRHFRDLGDVARELQEVRLARQRAAVARLALHRRRFVAAAGQLDQVDRQIVEHFHHPLRFLGRKAAALEVR